jgi:hypothetical protein
MINDTIGRTVEVVRSTVSLLRSKPVEGYGLDFRAKPKALPPSKSCQEKLRKTPEKSSRVEGVVGPICKILNNDDGSSHKSYSRLLQYQ